MNRRQGTIRSRGFCGVVVMLALLTLGLPARRRVEPDVEDRFQRIVQRLRPEMAAQLDNAVQAFNRELMQAGGEPGIQNASQRYAGELMAGGSGGLNLAEARFALLVQSLRDMEVDLQRIRDEITAMNRLKEKLRESIQVIRARHRKLAGKTGNPPTGQSRSQTGKTPGMAGAVIQQSGAAMVGQAPPPGRTPRLGITYFQTPKWRGVPELTGMSRKQISVEVIALQEMQGKVNELGRLNAVKLQDALQRQAQLLNVLSQAHGIVQQPPRGVRGQMRRSE